MKFKESGMWLTQKENPKILRGKHKPQYTPHVDTGDYVIVLNAEKVVRRSFTGTTHCIRVD